MSLQTDYPDFWLFVSNDAVTQQLGYATQNAAGNLPGAFHAADLANRDYFLLGLPVWIPAVAYNPPYGGANGPNGNWGAYNLPQLAIPSTVKLPSLTATQLTLITGGMTAAPPAPAPVENPKPAPKLNPGFDGGEFLDYCETFPEDPLCASLYGGESGGTITTVNNTTIINAGLSSTDVSGIIDGALAGVWQAATGAVDAVVAAVIGEVQGALTALGNAVKAAYAILSRLAGFVLNLLNTLLHDVLQGIVSALKGIVGLIDGLYNNVIKPALQSLQAIRKMLIDLYTRFIRPVLIVLQNIRKVLSILALFHVKFAAKLDAAIADIQARITQPLFYLLGYVNAVANWMNLIVTAGYLLQKPIFLNSLQAYVGSSLNLQINAMNQAPSASGLAALQAANKVPSPAQTSADFNQFVTSGTGSYPAAIAVNSPLIPTYSHGLIYSPPSGYTPTSASGS